ncbi:MAG: prephenate dehydrogenase [Halanaerobiales bacterium]|nr:prephenate dehydrogenase [Halanaerobiales bacterium]
MKQIGIIGLGLMGGSMGLAIKKYLPGVKVAGYDLNQNHLNYALKQGMVDQELSPTNIKEMEIIFIAVPVRSIITVLNEIYPEIDLKKTIVTDMGSTKAYLYQQIKEKFPGLRYVGGHPMTGREVSGPQGALADLFQNKNYILFKEAGKISSRLTDLLKKIGAEVIYLEPEEHDKLVAFTSHLPQLIATCLVNEIITVEAEFPLLSRLIGQGFLDLTRIAASDPKMWVDIFLTNKDNLITAIDKFTTRLKHFKDILLDEDTEKIAVLMLSGRNKRQQMEKVSSDGIKG